jgi:ATP-dependent helicase/nuclease subunit A
MTRARERLVFSRTEPHLAGTSWWARVETLAQPWQPAAPAQAVVDEASPIELQVLPPGPPARPTPVALRSPDTPATRLGQAVHRVLEWTTGQPAVADLADLAEAAAAEFGAPASEVARMAGAIWRNPQCRRFLAGPGLLWAGNEVPVADGGEVLRLDRLVQLQDASGPTWWVLDYKLALRPGEQAEYREQMLRYRRAVAALVPGDPVRCALVNGQGDVIEVT